MTKKETTTLQYDIHMTEPHKHIFTIALMVKTHQVDHVDFAMPAWTPGSYMIREFARHVVSLSAAAGGHPLEILKIDKHTWRVKTDGSAQLSLTYKVYAFELTVRTSYLDADHAMINGASLFLYPVDRKSDPVKVVLHKPDSWKIIAAGLEPSQEDDCSYLAQNYDQLLDSPIAVGNPSVYPFEVSGIPHKFVVFGTGNPDMDKITSDTAQILSYIHDMFGSVPYDRYYFFLHLLPGSYGGLEHHNSCHMMFDRFKFHKRKEYIRFLGLVSHEFFHCYNVKRIRPLGLGPFDYQKELYSPLHWITEGITSYYDNQFLLCAGTITKDEYLELIADDICKYLNTPGRKIQSTEEASFDQWIKLYRPDENTQNTSISYYLSGSLIAMALDLEIRRLSDQIHSLDDVYRQLWQNYVKTGKGFAVSDFKALCEKTAGTSLGNIWHSLSSTDEIDFDNLLAPYGLKITRSYKNKSEGSRSWLGVVIDDSLKIKKVISGGPADAAGLNTSDELLAVNDIRLNPKNKDELLGTLSLKRNCAFLIARKGDIRKILLKPKIAPHDRYRLVPVNKLSGAQKIRYRNWLGTEPSNEHNG